MTEDPFSDPAAAPPPPAQPEKAGVDFRLEVYDDVAHGFAVNDVPVYNNDAAERHWRELLALYKETLG